MVRVLRMRQPRVANQALDNISSSVNHATTVHDLDWYPGDTYIYVCKYQYGYQSMHDLAGSGWPAPRWQRTGSHEFSLLKCKNGTF